jgi:hypothetical protein
MVAAGEERVERRFLQRRPITERTRPRATTS